MCFFLKPNLFRILRYTLLIFDIIENQLMHIFFFISRVWKDLTLSPDADRAKYKVWDYPIKEKYSHMLETCKKNGMVKTREEGYQKVLDTLDGTFAFIDESARVSLSF